MPAELLLDLVLDWLLGGVELDDSVGGVDTDGDALLLVLDVGDGFGGFGGCVGCVGGEEGLPELLDVGEPGDVEPDDVELGVEVGDEDDDDDELDGEDGPTDVVVAQGGVPRWPGKRRVVLVVGNTAPGSTRRGKAVSDGPSVVGSTDSAVLETASVLVAASVRAADATEVAASVLVGAAAPEPKSALRCTRPIWAATREKPDTPPTAAATPEIDRAATVTAATTPRRAGVRLERA